MSQPIPQHLTSRLAAVLLAAATLGASACGAGDGDGVRITMDNLRFTPREATVRAGQRIEWRNDEKVPHNVAATSGADFRSMTLGDDGTFAFTARRPGTIQYVCTLHPGMTGSLRITGD